MTDEERQEHDHLPDETEGEGDEAPAEEGGITAPDPAQNPAERTSPPSNPEVDPERVERDSDIDRTVPG